MSRFGLFTAGIEADFGGDVEGGDVYMLVTVRVENLACDGGGGA